MAPLHPIRTTDSMARLDYPHLHYRLDGPMDRTHLHYRLDGPMTSFALPARWPDCIPSGLPHSRLDGPTASHPHYRLDGPTTSSGLPARWPDCMPSVYRTPGSMALLHLIRATGSMARLPARLHPIHIPGSMALMLPMRTTDSMARVTRSPQH